MPLDDYASRALSRLAAKEQQRETALHARGRARLAELRAQFERARQQSEGLAADRLRALVSHFEARRQAAEDLREPIARFVESDERIRTELGEISQLVERAQRVTFGGLEHEVVRLLAEAGAEQGSALRAEADQLLQDARAEEARAIRGESLRSQLERAGLPDAGTVGVSGARSRADRVALTIVSAIARGFIRAGVLQTGGSAASFDVERGV